MGSLNIKKLPKSQLIVFSLFTLSLFGALLFAFLFYKQTKQNVPPAKSALLTSSQVTPLPTEETQNNKNLNILLLGYGGQGHDGGYLSDTILIASIDPQAKKVTFISIPRDLWVKIPVDWDKSQSYKINHAFAIGGDETSYPNKKPEFRGKNGRGTLSKYVVGQVTGLPIKYYLSVDFSGLEKAIDLLGSVEVEVPKSFTDNFYPVKGLENETCNKTPDEIAELHKQYSGFELDKQFACRYEVLHFEKGLQPMDGATALKFVRSRHSQEYGGDFARSERQTALIKAIKNKIVTLEIIKKADPLFDQLADTVTSDIDAGIIQTILNFVGDYNDYTYHNIYITDQNFLSSKVGPGGQYILVPKAGEDNWSQIQAHILSELSK